MPRKRVVEKREVIADPKYKSVLVAKFVNNLMKKGKKSVAQSILYGSFDIISEKTKQDPLAVFQKAVENVKPAVEVKSRRVGGSTYQVPTEVRPSRRQALSIRWFQRQG
jgi:small subunit ribosomal protein S7